MTTEIIKPDQIIDDGKRMEIQEIPMEEIYIDEELNCRGFIAPFDVIELSKSIEKNGLIEPVAVQPWTATPPYKFRLLLGYRRHKAFQLLKREKIPSIIKHGVNDVQARVLNLQENLERKNLNPLQEAMAIKKFRDAGYTMAEIATLVNVSTGWVQIRTALLSLPSEIQKEAAAGFLTQSQIKDVYSLPSREEQFAAVKKIKEAKERGEKKPIQIKKPKINPLQKRPRRREEIFELMDHIQETIGNGFFTRCLSWCAGEINTIELLEDLREECKEKGIPYSIPSQYVNNI